MKRLYVEYGPKIFTRPRPSKHRLWGWIAEHLCKPSAKAHVLSAALTEVFGQETLGQVYERRKIALCIPSLRGSNFKAVVFKTPHNHEYTRDEKYSLVDVTMASAAAPVYFPLHEIPTANPDEEGNVYVDGGLWANTPILVGLVEALDIAEKDRPIEIVSVGNCAQPSGDPAALKSNDWGFFKWKGGTEVMNASIASQATGHEYIALAVAKALSQFGKNVKIYRLPETPKSPDEFSAVGLDKADKDAFKTLRAMATSDVDEANSELNKSSDPQVIPFKSLFSNIPFKEEGVSNA